MTFLALTGGVGGAKLALGLSRILPDKALAIVANTGDDFEHLGLRICPDLDTVMYTLADMSNKELGWGLAGETWHFMAAMERLGGETWFRLGDQDLATHHYRTRQLQSGKSLSEVTAQLCQRLGVRHLLFPMTNDPVGTRVRLQAGGELAFQHYFVRDRCEPVVSGFEFSGLSAARCSSAFADALERTDAAFIICPSNPFVSVAPLLSLDNVAARMKDRGLPVVAVSPIIGGQAIKGPAAKMMAELGMPQSALAVASYYADQFPGLLTHFVLDNADASLEAGVRALGLEVLVTNTFMQTLSHREQLARAIITWLGAGV